jgi:hypothetical protein
MDKQQNLCKLCWAKPRRHILDGELKTTSWKGEGGGGNDLKNESAFEDEQHRLDYALENEILKDKQKRIMAIEFGSTVETVSKALDNLLVLYQSDEDIDIKKATRAKAQSGILRLKDMGARELATHYSSQFPNPNRLIIIIALVFVVLITVILILTELGYMSSPLEEFIEEKLF